MLIELDLHELKFNFTESMKRAFWDILISDSNNRSLLRSSKIRTNYPIFHIRSPVAWHQAVLNGKNFMRHNLFTVSSAVVKLRDLWFEK